MLRTHQSVDIEMVQDRHWSYTGYQSLSRCCTGRSLNHLLSDSPPLFALAQLYILQRPPIRHSLRGSNVGLAVDASIARAGASLAGLLVIVVGALVADTDLVHAGGLDVGEGGGVACDQVSIFLPNIVRADAAYRSSG